MLFEGKPFQDYFPNLICPGCGPANKTAHGHRLKTYWGSLPALETICEWKPKKACESWPNTIHGGCTMSHMDCNAIWTATAARYDLEKRPFASYPYIVYVTAAFPGDSQLIKPIPIEIDHLTIISKVLELNKQSNKCILYSAIFVKGVKCAETKVLAVRPKLTHKEIKKYLGIVKI